LRSCWIKLKRTGEKINEKQERCNGRKAEIKCCLERRVRKYARKIDWET